MTFVNVRVRAADQVWSIPKPAEAHTNTQLFEWIGSPTRARTWDLRINSPSLYQLSYRGTGRNAAIVGRLAARAEF